MTENWFIQDIENQLQQRNRAVILDPTGQCEFLLPLVEKKGIIILRTDNELTEEWQTVQEELLLRYDAESKHKNDKIIFLKKIENFFKWMECFRLFFSNFL